MHSQKAGPNHRVSRADTAFLRHALIALALVALALLLWQLRDTLLLVFAGIVVAVMLRSLATPLQRRLGLPAGLSLAAVTLVLVALFSLIALLVGGEIRAQAADLARRLPQVIDDVLQRYDLSLPRQAGVQDAALSAAGTVAQQAMGLGVGFLSGVSALVVVVVGGFFLAVDPLMYRRGVALLLPPNQRRRALDAMVACGRALRLWMAAQLVSMIFVGVLSGLGSWALGLPSPLALGLFAGVTNVVPFLGAFAGAVPAVLLAATDSMSTLLWTGLLFLVIQQVESNVVTPLVQRRMVDLPPGLVIFAVVAVGSLFGLAGVILAAPLTVVTFVLVKKLHIRQTLGTPTDVPGEPG